jgi:hypothetical protein
MIWYNQQVYTDVKFDKIKQVHKIITKSEYSDLWGMATKT